MLNPTLGGTAGGGTAISSAPPKLPLPAEGEDFPDELIQYMVELLTRYAARQREPTGLPFVDH
jgi:hypothetical protein